MELKDLEPGDKVAYLYPFESSNSRCGYGRLVAFTALRNMVLQDASGYQYLIAPTWICWGATERMNKINNERFFNEHR